MTTLSELRAQIDELDHQILRLLAQRAETVHHIGQLKNTDEEVVAQDRQKLVYQTRRAWASELGLDPEFIENLYRLMIQHFIEQERRQLETRHAKE